MQRGVYPLQRADGLRHGIGVHMELWNSGHDLHLLERSHQAAAGISHHRLSSDGACHPQIRSRMDRVGPSGSPLSLG